MLDFKFKKEHLLVLLLLCCAIIPTFWKSYYSLPIILVIGYILFKDKTNLYKVTLLDIGIVILLFSEFITSVFSSNSFNSISSITRMFIVSFLYLLYKKYAKKGYNSFLYLMFFFIMSAVFIVSTVGYFRNFTADLVELGFHNFNDIKNLYSPLGQLSNIWGTFLILTLSFNLIFLLKLNKLEDKFLLFLNLALNLFCLVISFSRGIYISLVFFMLFIGILSFRYLKLKQFIFINLFAIATLIISGIIVKDSFLTTVKFNTTISQQRSTEGRTTLWKHSLKQFKEKPIFGFGQDNYIISNEKEPLISEDVIFNNRTNNTFIQLLIERGIFGIFCYFLFFIFVIKIIWKGLKSKSTTNKDKLQILIVASGLLAFLLREFTFSSFFENDFVNIVAFHLVFLLIPFDIDLKQITITKIRKKTIAYFGLTLFIIIGLLNIKKLLVTNYNKTFVRSYNSDEKDLQVEELDKALFLNSNNLTLIRHKALAFAKNSISIDISSNNMNLLDMKISNVDSLKLFKNQFLEILENKPNDHETFHNLGWLFMAEKDYSEAENYFENAIGINPYIVEYQCSLVLCKIAQSKLEEITDPLSKALQYSPDLLESIFYLELEKKYSSIAKTAKSDAIFNIQEKLKRNGNNPIFKARLARLILNEDKQNTYKLLNSVNETLPNLNRPWLYKGYLKSLELDTVSANMFFKKAKFLNSGDYLNFLYEGNYHRKFKNDSMAVENYERMIEIYKSLTSSSYINNAAWSRISTIRNSNIPEELLYYINPKFDTDRILNYMEEYYRKNDNDEKATQFKELKQRFQGKLFMGEID